MSGHFNPGLRNRPPQVVTLDDGRPLPAVGKVAPAAALTEEERENRWERMEREWNEAAEHVRKSREAWAEWLENDV